MHIPVGISTFAIRRNNPSNLFGGLGIRYDKTGKPKRHDGWDIGCREGSKIFAILDGDVVKVVKGAKAAPDGYGQQVFLRVRHNDIEYFLLYAHLKKVSVSVGESVLEGAVLGLSGRTGNAGKLAHVEDHLHFEVRKTVGGSPIDPSTLLGTGAIGDVFNSALRDAFMSMPKMGIDNKLREAINNIGVK